MSDCSLKEEFLKLLDNYRVEKLKELINKEIGKSIDKSLSVTKEGYFFNQKEIIWNKELLVEFRTQKGFTEKKLKKIIREYLGVDKSKLDVVDSLKRLKEALGIESYANSTVDMASVRKWIKKSKEIDKKYEPDRWLDWASSQAKNVNFATHVAKLTHSSIKGATNIYFDRYEANPKLLSTSSLEKKILDVSQTDSKLSPIGKFLQLECNGERMIDRLKEGDTSDIESFSTSKEQLLSWQERFCEAFKNTNPSSHFLSKQIYFPIGCNQYHMINPLVSSSLEQTIYEKIKSAKDNQEIKKQKRESKYHKELSIWYPNLAVIKVTTSNHNNSSPLNNKRGGRRYLFPSTPPQWKSSIKPPLHYGSLFKAFEYSVRQETKELQSYLLKIKDRQPNMHIRDSVLRNINAIIDSLFNYVSTIQNLKELSGWSQEEGSLKESHRLWLDPYCKDEEFQKKRAKTEWRDEVCLDFGLWLNKKLEHKKMLFVKINSDRWAKILKNRLREFELDLEALR